MTAALQDVVFNVVHNYPGGAGSIAPRLLSRDKVSGDLVAKSATSLSHEVQGRGSAKLGLLDAVKIMDLADSNALLEAYADHRGCDVIPRAPSMDPRSCTAKALRGTFKAIAAFGEKVCDAAEDDSFDVDEIRHIRKLWQEVSTMGNAVVRAATAKHLEEFPDSELAPIPLPRQVEGDAP